MTKKRIFLSPPHIGGAELQFIHEAFASNFIAPLGPMVDAFEAAFSEKVGLRHAAAVSSGTAAMHLALRCLDIGPGDEVFASSLTFIGSVSPIVFQGATPVFIDSDRATWNMDPDLLAEELELCSKRGRLPKAVIPTDIYGQCADYGRIFSMCEKYQVPVIIDAAEAMGATYQRTDDRQQAAFHHAGWGAEAAIYSFNGNKILTTSGGGMLASDDRELIDHARKLSQQAREHFVHYEHEEIGYNYRMSNILAAIGLGQLKVLEERVAQKRKIFEYYSQSLGNVPGIEFMPEASYGRSNKWITVILISPEKFGADYETVRLALEAENIESRPLWKPMHAQPVFQIVDRREQGEMHRAGRVETGKPEDQEDHGRGKMRYRARAVGGAISDELFNRGLCLPSGTAMTEEDLNRVVKVIIGCRK